MRLPSIALLLVVLLCLPLVGQEKKDEPGKDDVKKADKNELPLDPAGKLEFETDEATWLSLDVAPDGQSLVFELLGDLYRLPMTGGDAVPPHSR